jgi:23S rRNA-/tRNA-specific pseudouridylate synthase
MLSRMNTTMSHAPTIIYEDNTMIVVDKPYGLLVHEDGKSTEPTLVDWFLERCPEAKGVGESTHLARWPSTRAIGGSAST